jgi:hypothetical protein
VLLVQYPYLYYKTFEGSTKIEDIVKKKKTKIEDGNATPVYYNFTRHWKRWRIWLYSCRVQTWKPEFFFCLRL